MAGDPLASTADHGLLRTQTPTLHRPPYCIHPVPGTVLKCLQILLQYSNPDRRPSECPNRGSSNCCSDPHHEHLLRSQFVRNISV